MQTTAVGGASAPKNNAQNQAPSKLICKWSIDTAPPGTEVQIVVNSESDINVTTAIINIYQWFDNRRHPVDVFKVPFTNKRDANFQWKAKGANGADHEKGALYFDATVGSSRGTSGPLQLRGKAVAKPQKPVDKFETVVQKRNMPNLMGG